MNGVRVFAAWLLLGTAMLAQQSTERAPGVIPRLSSADYEEAKRCGREGAKCAVSPYEICPSEAARYSIRVATPFSRVALALHEGSTPVRPGRGMDRGNANQWGTGIYVFPAARSASAAGIERLEIQREGRTIQPLTTTVGPIAVSMLDGSTRQLARGYFAFPPETFAPTAEVTILLTGSAGQTVCVLARDRLETLR
jgi:hypothetical protein